MPGLPKSLSVKGLLRTGRVAQLSHWFNTSADRHHSEAEGTSKHTDTGMGAQRYAALCSYTQTHTHTPSHKVIDEVEILLDSRPPLP